MARRHVVGVERRLLPRPADEEGITDVARVLQDRPNRAAPISRAQADDRSGPGTPSDGHGRCPGRTRS